MIKKHLVESAVDPDPGDYPEMKKSIEESTKVADGKGLRYDTGKNLLDLIPPEWTWALGMILTKGAAKYAKRNWERGMPWSKVMGPLKRHLAKFEAGEDYDYGTSNDPGTNCHHLAIVAWNALALMTYELRDIGERDLPKYDFSILGKVCDDANSIQPKEE